MKSNLKPMSMLRFATAASFAVFSQASFSQTAATAPAGAASAVSASPASRPAAVARADERFMTKAAVGGLFEVEAGKLAAGKASDAGVKSFGNMLSEHHTAANDELKQLASKLGVTLPTSLPADKRRDLDRLGKLGGAEFDRAYLREVGLKDHRADIKDFEKASKDAKNAEVKAFANKTLPTLRQHLAEAEKLSKTASSSRSSG